MRKALFVLAAAVSLWLAPGALASGWCGNGETSVDRPDVVTGRQIHAVVAVPADGADTFGTDAPRLADDVAALEAWWVGQDPTREPRFDDAVFAGQPCLDISFVRLPVPAAAFTDARVAFEGIVEALLGLGFDSQYKKYLVYYDGPAPEADVCGVGGGQFDTGPAYATVLLAGCPGVPNDAVATHELLHALGAVPPGDPNACPTDPAHVCDSMTDILYPFTAGAPLSQVVLDYNHNDYYGHSGTWPDIQDSLWLRHLDTPEEALGIGLSGTGTIASDVPGVICTTSCVTHWDQGSLLTLMPEPGRSSRFVGWTGACKGSGDCPLQLDQPVSVGALFGPLRIPLRVSTAGRGRVVCSPACSNTLPAGTSLSLRAVAAKGWRFGGWSGGCKGRQPTCVPKTDFALSIRATFRRR